MDSVLIQKILTQFAYPTGFIFACAVLGIALRIIQFNKLSFLFKLLSISAFLLSTNFYIAHYLVNSLEKQYPQLSIEQTPKADAVIVLGGSFSPPAQPRKFSQLTNTSNRFWLASKLYKAGKVQYIVLSGGNVFQQYGIKPESHYIKGWLISSGIPASAIIIEGESRTTRENAIETKKLLQGKLLQNKSINTALLMTSAIHMPRSMQLFSILENEGVNIIPAPSDIIATDHMPPKELRIIPSVEALSLTTKALHEYYGIWVESISRSIKKSLAKFINSE